jgi:hypothetical protein
MRPFQHIFKFGPDAQTGASKEIAEYWVPRLVREDLVPRAMAAAKQGRPIFFQGQLRYLAAEAMRLDPARRSAVPWPNQNALKSRHPEDCLGLSVHFQKWILAAAHGHTSRFFEVSPARISRQKT